MDSYKDYAPRAFAKIKIGSFSPSSAVEAGRAASASLDVTGSGSGTIARLAAVFGSTGVVAGAGVALVAVAVATAGVAGEPICFRVLVDTSRVTYSPGNGKSSVNEPLACRKR